MQCLPSVWYATRLPLFSILVAVSSSHTCTHACRRIVTDVHTCKHYTYIHTHTRVHTQVYVNASIFAYIIHKYLHMYVHTYIHSGIHPHTRTYTHHHTYAHTLTHAPHIHITYTDILHSINSDRVPCGTSLAVAITTMALQWPASSHPDGAHSSLQPIS